MRIFLVSVWLLLMVPGLAYWPDAHAIGRFFYEHLRCWNSAPGPPPGTFANAAASRCTTAANPSFERAIERQPARHPRRCANFYGRGGSAQSGGNRIKSVQPVAGTQQWHCRPLGQIRGSAFAAECRASSGWGPSNSATLFLLPVASSISKMYFEPRTRRATSPPTSPVSLSAIRPKDGLLNSAVRRSSPA